MLPVPRGVLWWYICRVACKGPKSRLGPQDQNRHRAEVSDPSLTSGATAARSVVEKAATQSFRALESAVKGGGIACGVPAYLYRDPATLWWCVPGGTGRPYWSPFFFLRRLGFRHTEVIKNLSERYTTFALAGQ